MPTLVTDATADNETTTARHGRHCQQCHAVTCNCCLVGDACPKCEFDVKDYFDKHDIGDATAVQHQQCRPLKAGSKKLVDSGLKQAKRLSDAHVRPLQVRKVLDTEILQAERVTSIMAMGNVTVKNTFLIEWCCERDSYLMKEWRRLGGVGLRVALPVYDAGNDRHVNLIVDKARAYMKKGYHVRLHASLPCTMWSAWSRLNAKVFPA